MKILWATIDRSNRVASHIFTTLQNEMAKIAEVDFITRVLDKKAGVFCQDVMNGKTITSRLIDPVEANKYDLVFTDAMFAYMHEEWNKINTTKGVLMEDQHGPMVAKYIGDAFRSFGFEIFATRYRDATKNFHPYLYKKKVIWTPHSIDPELFYDYGEKRNIGLLSVGVLNGQVYPIRLKIHGEMETNPQYFRVNRPQEKMNGKVFPKGKDYVDLLNKANITASCISKFKYPILKTFEVPACGSILMSDGSKEMNDLGFINEENFIQVNVRSHIADIVRKTLGDPEKMTMLKENGKKLIRERHTGNIRAREFMGDLKKCKS